MFFNLGVISSQVLGQIIPPTGWSYGTKLTIPSSAVTETLTNFPVPVYLNTANFDFTKAKSDGSDIRFTDSLLNFYKHEKVEYSQANQFAKFNVLVPTVSNSANTEFLMWYENQNAYNTSIEAHQDQTGKQLTYNGNVKLEYDSVSGKRRASFDGNGDYFSLPVGGDMQFGTGDFTVEITCNVTNNTLSAGLLAFAPPAQDYNFFIEYSDSRGFCVYTGNTLILQALTTKKGQNTNVVVSRKNGTLYMYENNILIKSVINTVDITLPSAMVIGRGAVLTNNYYFNGFITGIRITKGLGRYDSVTVPPMAIDYKVDSSNVVFCTNFDTIYDQTYSMVQHMGDSLIDATGNNNSAVATSSIVTSTTFGKARSFNGTSSKLVIPDSTSSELGSNSFMITCMNKPSTVSGNLALYSKGTSTSIREYHCDINSGQWRFWGNQNSATDDPTIIGGSGTATTSDQVISVSRQLNNFKLWKDNLELGSDTYTGSIYNSTGTTNIGVNYAGTGLYYSGIINHFSIEIANRVDSWIKLKALLLQNNIITYTSI